MSQPGLFICLGRVTEELRHPIWAELLRKHYVSISAVMLMSGWLMHEENVEFVIICFIVDPQQSGTDPESLLVCFEQRVVPLVHTQHFPAAVMRIQAVQDCRFD